MATKPQMIFRRAKVEDITYVIQMIQELAEYENYPNGPEMTVEQLIHDSGLNGGREFCHVYILELLKDGAKEAIPIGYTICYFGYSTWQGRTYSPEDIYVKPEYRRIGAGARILRELAAIAKEYGSKRFDFHVSGWNPARKFYESMGANCLTETEGWQYYRVEEEQIEKLANELVKRGITTTDNV